MSDPNKTQNDASKAGAEETAAAKAAKKVKGSESGPRPAWQEPDYHGPLDGEQAMWRNKHIDRLGNHNVKPAKVGETK